jgi:predicted flap endonuclease-1-like 5' DNA nuclease
MPKLLVREQAVIPKDLIINFALDKSEFNSNAKTDKYFDESNEYLDQNSPARELVDSKDRRTELFKRISERKGRIYYDRFGVARKHEANNLILIDGLGLWVEARLNILGIFTFNQISKLTHTDIETITEVLEIIPGCIEEDNWIGQALELAKKQHQKKLKNSDFRCWRW